MPDGAPATSAVARERRWLSPATRLPFPPIVAERGAGTRFWAADGREFLDFHSMACILNTGHNHPLVVDGKAGPLLPEAVIAGKGAQSMQAS